MVFAGHATVNTTAVVENLALGDGEIFKRFKFASYLATVPGMV